MRVPLGLVVFVVGASTLGAEIAATRLLAPSFGASTIVWANTIGVVLVALSVGYWVGGRVADRNPTLRGLLWIVLVGAVLLAIVPFVSGPFLDIAVSALDSISAGAFVGSLIAVLALVAVPILVLGMVAPYGIRLAVETLEDAGKVSGRLYAISTVGSLVGTMGSSLALIPLLGTRRTFLAMALALALIAVVGLARAWTAIVPAAIIVAIALPVGVVKDTGRPGVRVLAEVETSYQYARVIETASGSRRLELNEGQAIHSERPADGYLTGNIWDEMLIAPLTASGRPPGRIAILGNAAGTVARAYNHYFPDTFVDGVELDGEVTRLGREYFDLRAGPRLELFTADARPFLRRAERRYDTIIVDAYRQPYIPFYLTTREFFTLARKRLNPGGVVLVNVGEPEDSTRLERVLGATLNTVFTTVLRDRSEAVNTVLIAGNDRPSAERLRAAIPRLPSDLRERAVAAVARIEPYLPGGEIYTDDHAPVEWLIDSSILRIAARGER